MSVSNTCADYGSPVDIFSMGIILWQMLSSSRPYAHLWPTARIPNRYILLNHIAQEGLRPEIPGWVHAPLAALVKECWAKAEDGRPTATELVRRLQVPHPSRPNPPKLPTTHARVRTPPPPSPTSPAPHAPLTPRHATPPHPHTPTLSDAHTAALPPPWPSSPHIRTRPPAAVPTPRRSPLRPSRRQRLLPRRPKPKALLQWAPRIALRRRRVALAALSLTSARTILQARDIWDIRRGGRLATSPYPMIESRHHLATISRSLLSTNPYPNQNPKLTVHGSGGDCHVAGSCGH
eukprot:1222637-Prymnesium_polylepis.1